MKKLFIVLAVASLGFVACNNESAEKPAETTDTTKVETPAPAPAADSTSTPAADSTATTDSAAKK